jgi:hypothetical protein
LLERPLISEVIPGISSRDHQPHQISRPGLSREHIFQIILPVINVRRYL